HLPDDPDTLTVGQLTRLLDDQAKSWAIIEKNPTQFLPDDYVRRNQRLCESPSYRQFVKWANIELGRDADFDAAQELYSRLAKRQRMIFADIDLMPLADAMRLLEQPEAASPPPPRGDETTAVAADASGIVTPEAPAELPDLVTLDQAAARVHRSKRTLERYKTKGTLPEPTVEGGGGKFALYDWKIMRPWLTKEFGVILPERFSGG
ncbi:MAG: hypothetical protein ACHRXM_19305, partial [Isosphaerales bacterium]